MPNTLEVDVTIQQAATISGLSVHTLRYYERVGLIDPVERSASGHRRYTQRDLTWIKLLIRLRGTGMAIGRMQEFARLRRLGDATLAERLQLLEEHRAAVTRQMRQLDEYAAAIDAKIAIYTAQIEQLLLANG